MKPIFSLWLINFIIRYTGGAYVEKYDRVMDKLIYSETKSDGQIDLFGI